VQLSSQIPIPTNSYFLLFPQEFELREVEFTELKLKVFQLKIGTSFGWVFFFFSIVDWKKQQLWNKKTIVDNTATDKSVSGGHILAIASNLAVFIQCLTPQMLHF